MKWHLYDIYMKLTNSLTWVCWRNSKVKTTPGMATPGSIYPSRSGRKKKRLSWPINCDLFENGCRLHTTSHIDGVRHGWWWEFLGKWWEFNVIYHQLCNFMLCLWIKTPFESPLLEMLGGCLWDITGITGILPFLLEIISRWTPIDHISTPFFLSKAGFSCTQMHFNHFNHFKNFGSLTRYHLVNLVMTFAVCYGKSPCYENRQTIYFYKWAIYIFR